VGKNTYLNTFNIALLIHQQTNTFINVKQIYVSRCLLFHFMRIRKSKEFLFS